VAKWLYVSLALLAATLVGSLAANSLLTLFGLVQPATFWASYIQSVKFALFITYIFGSGIVVYETMRAELRHATLQLRNQELEREIALKLAAEARLSSLESRIHPHFLFNALNSVSALIREDPERAERLVERIAALLRSSLDADSSLVSLETELKIVEDYLEIEKTRFGARLQYRIDVPADLDTVEIPRFSLQTLVENSVKYVVSRRPEGGIIRIHAVRSGERAHIEVADDGPGFDAAAIPPGHGLDLLQSRLLTLFAMDAALRFERSDAGMCVTLSLPAGHESLSRR
jgi:LytS/YehU family sensor histidine kinase